MILINLLIICKDIQLNCDDIQVLRRQSKLKILNSVVSITLVITKDVDLAIHTHNKLEYLKDISDVYLTECSNSKLKSVLQNLLANKYAVRDILISNCINKNDVKLIQTLLEKNPCIKLSLFEIYLSDEIATEMISVFNQLIESEQINYIVKSNTILVAYKSYEQVITRALETPDCQIDSLHLLCCSLSKSEFYKIGVKMFKKSRYFKQIVISGTNITEKIDPLFCKLWLKNWPVCIKVFDISSNQLTMSCARVIFKTMRSCVIEVLIIHDSTKMLNTLIVAEFENGQQPKNFILGIPVIIINNISIGHKHTTAILSNCDIGNQVRHISKTQSKYKISVCSFYFLNSNLFPQDDDFLYYCQQFSTIQLHVYINDTDINYAASTSLKMLQSLSENPEMNVSYFCAVNTTLLGNKSNHWIIRKVLASPSIVNLRFTNCKSELFNHLFYTALTSIRRHWQQIDFSNCDIDHHDFLKMTDCFLRNDSTIQSLDLSHNKLTEASIMPLVKLILYCEVSTVNLSFNKLKDM